LFPVNAPLLVKNLVAELGDEERQMFGKALQHRILLLIIIVVIVIIIIVTTAMLFLLVLVVVVDNLIMSLGWPGLVSCCSCWLSSLYNLKSLQISHAKLVDTTGVNFLDCHLPQTQLRFASL
jgi:hypothetical protein